MFGKKVLPLRKELLGNLVYDYLMCNEKVRGYYSFFPDKNGFENALKSIGKFSFNRDLLMSELLQQSKLVSNTSSATTENIKKLSSGTVYTVTTGHQLCLFTGPSYFVYKIFSAINLCEKLKSEFPENDFVPVYWMASEDHDFAEVNNFSLFGKKITWESEQAGAVGEFNSTSVADCVDEFRNILGNSEYAPELIILFEQSYLKHTNMAESTRYLVNELFGKYGLVIADGNSKNLKKSFAAFFEKDIFEGFSEKPVNETIECLKKDSYSIQVNPRAVNCFYMDKNVRARIEAEGNNYRIVGTDKIFTPQELKSVIQNETEKISPNVVLRPCYQQFILPNLAYVGGPGELAYWLEYKSMMEAYGLFYPVLSPRKFITIIDKNSINKLEKLKMEKEMIFENADELIKIYLEKSNQSFNVQEYKKNITDLFKNLSDEVAKIDKSLVAATESEKQRNLNSLENLEQKANRAVKAKMETEVNQIRAIKLKYFPDGIPQERVENFSAYYAKWGKDFLNVLKQNLTYDLKNNTVDIIFEN